MKTRKEFDSIGSIKVPAEKYWGASTERSNKFFNIGKILVNPSIIKSIAIIKRSAAIVHAKDKLIDKKISNTIVKAADEVIKVIDTATPYATTAILTFFDEILDGLFK